MEACPACGGALLPWLPVPAAEPALRSARFALQRCERCGTAVTVGEAPAALHETGAYGAGSPRLYRLAKPLLAAFDRQRLSFVRELVPPPARLLDAGAGRGRFTLAARAAGYDATGIEPSARGWSAAAAIRAPVEHVGIENADIAAGSLDAATLWHVLEHLDRPADALERIAGWLRPGGGLVVGVPNLASFQARIGYSHWYHLDVPRHHVHFTVRGVHELLRLQGFEVVRTHHVLLEHNPFGLWQSLVNRVTRQPSYLYNLLKRNAPFASADLALTVAAVPLLAPAAAAELLAGLAGRGGTVAVLARRRG